MSILLSLLERSRNLGIRRDGENLLHVLKLSKIYQEGNGSEKKLQLTSLLGLSLLIMTACATNGTTSDITAESADFGVNLFYFFAEIIRFYRLISVSE